MKRMVLFIDDKDNELNLMTNALCKEIKELNLEDNLEVDKFQICCDKKLNNKTLETLIIKIKTELEIVDGLLIAIDLNLVGDNYNSIEMLERNLMTGILLKRYIDKTLDENLKIKMKFLFITNYLNKEGTSPRKSLIPIIEEEQVEWVSKPTRIEGKAEYVENEPHICKKKECKLSDENYKIKIKNYYDKETIYDDFIGALMENVLNI